MKINLETQVVAPDSVYIPIVQIMTRSIGGRLQVSGQITFGAGKCDNPGTDAEQWQMAAQTAAILIPDLLNLDGELTSLRTQGHELYSKIMDLAAAINAIRKVL